MTLGGEMAVCHLDPGHKADGATFNHFGLLAVVKSADGGDEVWLDDVSVNGDADDFSRDPCVWYWYKDPADIPARHWERHGLRKS